MSTKTISLDEEAYKREGESFSDVIKRISDKRSWTEVAGILSEAEAGELESLVRAGRSGSTDRRD